MSEQPEPLLEFFSTETPYHNWFRIQLVESFEYLANSLVRNIDRSPERTVALRKLLESRDAALRAIQTKDED